MPKFTNKQRDEAAEFLRNPRDILAHRSEQAGLQEHSQHLFEQLRAKVILGEFRTDESQNDWNIARTNLTAQHQAELRKLLGWD